MKYLVYANYSRNSTVALKESIKWLQIKSLLKNEISVVTLT